MSLEDIVSALPQEAQDTLKLAQIEAEENAQAFAQSARDKNMPLAVEQDGEVYLNTKFISATISLLAPKVLMGLHSSKDVESLVVTLSDAIRGAEIYVKG